jgi:hypothetical protein
MAPPDGVGSPRAGVDLVPPLTLAPAMRSSRLRAGRGELELNHPSVASGVVA